MTGSTSPVPADVRLMPTSIHADDSCHPSSASPLAPIRDPTPITSRAGAVSSRLVKNRTALTNSITPLHTENISEMSCVVDPRCCRPCSTMPSSKPETTKLTIRLRSHSRITPVRSPGGVVAPAASGCSVRRGSVSARPSIIEAPRIAARTRTTRVARTSFTAGCDSTVAIAIANAFSAGPNRKPSRDAAPSHAKRRARRSGGVYTATRAGTTGTTAATKNPVDARRPYSTHKPLMDVGSSNSRLVA